MSKRVEYLIVGAGAAGSALALLLREAGCEVLLLELRDLASKDKLCGGVLGREAIEGLRAIFGEGALAELDPIFPPFLRNRCLDHELARPLDFAALPRKRLDDWLVARCQEAGVEVLDRMRLDSVDGERRMASCVDLRSGERVRIGFATLVGADGATSAVRRLCAGRKQRVMPAFEGEVPLAGKDIVFGYHPLRKGYCWYIPTGEAANVGCMLHDGSPEACRAWLQDFCEGLGIAFPALRGAPIPTGDDVLLRVDEGVWFVGDAAGLARPFDGGGIHYAFASARLLAEAFLGGAPYEEAMRPMLAEIGEMADNLERDYFFNALRIARKGYPWGKAAALAQDDGTRRFQEADVPHCASATSMNDGS